MIFFATRTKIFFATRTMICRLRVDCDHLVCQVAPSHTMSQFAINDADEMNEQDQVTRVWTDGACSKNGSIDSSAGIGVWFGHGDSRNVSEPVAGYCTSYRAELEAVVRAMTITLKDQSVVIYCDNRTVVDGFVKYNLDQWAKDGWKVDVKELVAWQHIWLLQLGRRHLKLNPVVVKHVFGHADDHGNQEADKLAVHGRKSKISSMTRMSSP